MHLKDVLVECVFSTLTNSYNVWRFIALNENDRERNPNKQYLEFTWN